MVHRRCARRFAPLAVCSLVLAGAMPPLAASGSEQEAIEQIATSSVRVSLETTAGEPAVGATVVLTAMDVEGFEGRCVTDDAGRCTIEPLVYGLYRVAIVSNDEAFIGNRTVIVRPDRKEKLEITLGGFQPADARLGLRPGEPVPALDRPAAGVARIAEKDRASGWAWVRTGKGVAAIVGSSALLVGLLISASEDTSEPSVSPVQ